MKPVNVNAVLKALDRDPDNCSVAFNDDALEFHLPTEIVRISFQGKDDTATTFTSEGSKTDGKPNPSVL